ncbi:MAG: hypothetical protein WAT81_03125 [Candidatus Moraniibacteriota bacterium]
MKFSLKGTAEVVLAFIAVSLGLVIAHLFSFLPWQDIGKALSLLARS